MSSSQVILFAIVALLAAAAQAKSCHNVTGTCLDHGFVCANDQVVPHAKRCDGIEDCADGTDEFMCDHQDERPMHLRTAEERAAVEQASCIRCTCVKAVLSIGPSSAWLPFAKVAPTDTIGLMTGTGTYGGRPCNPTCVWTIQMAFYKKTKVCRGMLCCARQRSCVQCYPLFPCAGFSSDFNHRCYA